MEEELREKIAEVIDVSFVGMFYAPSPEDRERVINEYADNILTLIREAGYEPPESVREMVEKSYADGVDDTEQKYKGYMSPEEVEKRIEMILGGNNK